MEFFRHCPQCGRRFHIKLVGKKLAHVDREPIRTTDASPTIGGSGLLYGASMPYFIVREGPPVIIDIEEFQYAYKCNHCGHEWSEKHVEEHKEG
jgi:DNA-directed RNA polymerase subunit RPC12/RpoP